MIKTGAHAKVIPQSRDSRFIPKNGGIGFYTNVPAVGNFAGARRGRTGKINETYLQGRKRVGAVVGETRAMAGKVAAASGQPLTNSVISTARRWNLMPVAQSNGPPITLRTTPRRFRVIPRQATPATRSYKGRKLVARIVACKCFRRRVRNNGFSCARRAPTDSRNLLSRAARRRKRAEREIDLPLIKIYRGKRV